MRAKWRKGPKIRKSPPVCEKNKQTGARDISIIDHSDVLANRMGISPRFRCKVPGTEKEDE